MTSEEIFCTGGMGGEPIKVFKNTDRRGRTFYAIHGGYMVNITYDRLEDGSDLDTLYDVDSFAWYTGINSLEEFENAIN